MRNALVTYPNYAYSLFSWSWFKSFCCLFVSYLATTLVNGMLQKLMVDFVSKLRVCAAARLEKYSEGEWIQAVVILTGHCAADRCWMSDSYIWSAEPPNRCHKIPLVLRSSGDLSQTDQFLFLFLFYGRVFKLSLRLRTDAARRKLKIMEVCASCIALPWRLPQISTEMDRKALTCYSGIYLKLSLFGF